MIPGPVPLIGQRGTGRFHQRIHGRKEAEGDPPDVRAISQLMCIVDRKTREVLKDCGFCNCGQSSNAGNHRPRKTGEVIVVGKKIFNVYKCTKCNAYT
jgi:hypothetical protein